MAEKHPREDVGGAEAMRCKWPARDPGRAPAGSVDCVAHVLPHRGDRFSRGKALQCGNKQGADGLEILMRLPRTVCLQALSFMTGDQMLTVSHFLPGELCEAFCQRRLKRLTERGCDTWVTDDGGDCLDRTNNTFFFFEAFEKRVKSNLKIKTDTLFPGAKKDTEPYLASIESEIKQISARLSPETHEYEATNSDLYQDAQTPLAAMMVKLPWTQLFVANQLLINAIDESMSHETFHVSEDLLLAAMLGHPLAQFEIAVSYMRASEVLVPTLAYERCIFWLLQSVDVLPRAQFCLATALNFADEQLRPPTKRFPVSCQTIFNLYSAAAKKGHPSACVNVGMIYHGDFPFQPDSIGLSDFQVSCGYASRLGWREFFLFQRSTHSTNLPALLFVCLEPFQAKTSHGVLDGRVTFQSGGIDFESWPHVLHWHLIWRLFSKKRHETSSHVLENGSGYERLQRPFPVCRRFRNWRWVY